MTEQEQKAFDQMREALMAAEFHLVEVGKRGNGLHKQCEDALTAANAVSHPQATEPAGWKLVPVDATRNQLVTGWNAIAGRLDHPTLAHLYGAMLAAAPSSPLPASRAAMPFAAGSTPASSQSYKGEFNEHTRVRTRQAGGR